MTEGTRVGPDPRVILERSEGSVAAGTEPTAVGVTDSSGEARRMTTEIRAQLEAKGSSHNNSCKYGILEGWWMRLAFGVDTKRLRASWTSGRAD